MKFIGQSIEHFIARFRNDVYLEDVSSGTIASGGNLGLDSNNKIVKAAIASSLSLEDTPLTTNGLLTYNTTNEATVEQFLTFNIASNISTLLVGSDQNTDDHLKINVTTNGATTLATQDGDAELAHLTIYPDGDLKNQARTGLNYWYKGSNTDDYLKLEIGTHGNAIFTTVDANAAAADMTFTPDGAFYVNSDDIRFTSDQANDPLVQIRGEANDATGPRLRFMKNRGADGQDNDVCGILQFYSYDDGTPSTQNYAEIKGTIHDATAGEESGKLELNVASHDGSANNGLVLIGGSANNEVDVTIGNGSASLTTIAGTLTMGSTAFVNNSGVIQVATQGTIDHDSLANFVANEHIDWTTDQGGTNIHAGNYNNTQLTNEEVRSAAGTASTSATGLVELATDGEIDTGTDTARAVTPSGLKSHLDSRFTYQYITFIGNADIATNWAIPGTNGPFTHNYNTDTGVNGTSVGSTTFANARAKQQGFVVPFDSAVLVGFYGMIRNNTANNQGALGLFHSTYATFGAKTTTSTFTLQAYAAADQTGGAGTSYQGQCKAVDLSRSLDLTAGDIIVPAILQASEKAYAQFTIVIKTPII